MNSILHKYITIGCILAVVAFGQQACAEEITKVDFDNHKVVLLGDKLPNGYVRNLLLRVETDNVPYTINPDVSGGYWPELKVVTLRKGEQQILFSARQGGQNATSEYRIFAKVKNKLKPVFEATESRGVIREATLGNKELRVSLLNGTEQAIPLNEKIWEKVTNSYDRGYEPSFDGIYSMIARDVDNDGIQELFLTQRIDLANQELGYMAVRMYLQKDESWRMNHYVFQMPTLNTGTDKLNEGVTTPAYEIHPVKIYIEKAQGAYPVFYGVSDKVAKSINRIWQTVYEPYMNNLFAENAAMGFEVVLSYENILSMRFIGGPDRWNKFVHVDPATGREMGIDSMFIVNNKFLKTMSILSPSNHRYKEKDLKNWFMKGTKVHILYEEDGKQKAEQFALSAFEGFLRPDNQILQKKVD